MKRDALALPAGSTTGAKGLLLMFAAILLLALPSSAAAADPCGNASLRALQGSANLPDCRAYEMVSPTDKNGGSVLWGAGGLQTPGLFSVTADGGTVAYDSYQPFPQSENGMGSQPYRASRTGSGWETTAIGPTGLFPNPTTIDRVTVLDATADFSKSIFESNGIYDPLDQDTLSFPGFSARLPDVYRLESDGSVDWISRPNGGLPATELKVASYVGRSADASRVFFKSDESLVPEAEPIAEFAHYLYVNGPGGTELVNADENGDMIDKCGATMGSDALNITTQHAVSEDGQRVFFQVPDPEPRILSVPEPSCYTPPRLFLRDGNELTDVSASQMSAPDPIEKGATFQAASASGSRVFFTSGDRLTDDATPGGGLYAYDVESEQLSFLSTGAGGPEGAEVLGVVKSSDDGSHVYFIAKAQLDGSKGTAGGYNLYLWTPGSVRFVATVAEGDGLLGLEESRPVRISANGSQLLFLSSVDQTEYPAEGTVQAYLWSEDGGTTLCVSCDPAGEPPTGRAFLRSRATQFGAKPYNHDSRNLLEDGRILFETSAALVRSDVNGAIDVYEYTPGGAPHLISDGKARYGSFFFDASADGRDVFFSTQGSLVPQDVDNGENDLYDARVDGGFFPPQTAASCVGEACQGTPPAAPAAPELGSAAVARPNSTASGKRVLGPLSKRVSGFVATVRAQVGSAGTLSANGPGLSPAKKSVKKAGAYSLKLLLNRDGKARLQARGQVGIRVEVRFAPAGGSAVTRSIRVRFVAECGKKCKNANGRVQG